MFLETGYGTTIYLSLEEFLSLTDEEWKNVVNMDNGEFINDPFSKKVSYSKNNTPSDKISSKEIEDDFDK